MRIDVVSLFPEMIRELAGYGILRRAVDQGLLDLQTWNPRDFARDRHRSVDDRPYGGGPGMVMQVGPLCDSIRAARKQAGSSPVIYLSPQGRQFDQRTAQRFAGLAGLILVSGRYEGVDERAIELEVDEEWSIGDYVLTGGELPVMVVIDAVTRLLPGALGDGESAQQDSFMQGLLDYPHYTRPEFTNGLRVPDVLLGGNHADIVRWRNKQALGRTWQRRPDLLQRFELSDEQEKLLEEYIRERADGGDQD